MKNFINNVGKTIPQTLRFAQRKEVITLLMKGVE